MELIIDANASVWVPASAGTGKTTQLTRRVLALLLEGVAPERLLCITYTNAAAAEMNERVHGILSKWVVMEEGALAAELAEEYCLNPPSSAKLQRARRLFADLLESPEGLRIQTIHSFCQSILRRFPLEAGVAPQFTVIDDVEADSLIQRAMRGLLQQHGTEVDTSTESSLARLAQYFSDTGLQDLFRHIIEKRGDWYYWLNQPGKREACCRQLAASLDIELAGDTSANTIFNYTPEELVKLKAAISVLESGKATDKKMALALSNWLASDRTADAALLYCGTFLTSKGEVKETIVTKAIGDDIQALLRIEQQRALRFSEYTKVQQCYALNADIYQVADSLLAAYTQLKLARGVLDYYDLISKASQLLSKPDIAPWVLFKLDGGIDHLLLDEAQDTSPEQWQIVRLLTEDFFAGASRYERSRSLFVVGDEKQSIFSFQGADMAEFQRMQRYFTQRISDAEKPFSLIPLTISYRSTDMVLALVDRVCARIGMQTSHQVHRAGQAGRVELWPLIAKPEEVKDEDAKPDAVAELAEAVAAQIAQWLQEKRLLKAKNRPIQPGDIMILVQNRAPFVGQLIARLKAQHIPVSGTDRMLLRQHLAVQDMLALGKFLLLPSDDYSLACILKSPIGGFSEDALFTLAHGRGELSLWECLSTQQPGSPIYQLLAQLLAMADYTSPYRLYAELLDVQQTRMRFLERMGPETDEALNAFLEQALKFESSRKAGLMDFIRWIETSHIELKRTLAAGGMVRILTAHGSKGLQAPVVFLVDTARMPKSRSGILWQRTDDKAMPVWAGSSAERCGFVQTLHDEGRIASLDEYYRLLYVALTRAEDELIIAGATHTKKANDESWYAIIQGAIQPVAQPCETPTGVGLCMQSDNREPLKSEAGEAVTALPAIAPPAAILLPVSETLDKVAPLSPSELLGLETKTLDALPGAQNHTRERGKAIHALLQHMGAFGENREVVAENWLAAHYPVFHALQRTQMIHETFALLNNPQLATLLAGDGLNEAPIIGTILWKGRPQPIRGQIDRLVVLPEEVWVLDYKTHANPPADPSSVDPNILAQMAVYVQLVRQIYPSHKVKAALIWTAGPVFMEIPAQLLHLETLDACA